MHHETPDDLFFRGFVIFFVVLFVKIKKKFLPMQIYYINKKQKMTYRQDMYEQH